MTYSPPSALEFFARHWIKLATGLVIALGLLELATGSPGDSNQIEFYLLAWGSMVSGVWFLFDVAEKTAREEFREQVRSWILQTEVAQQIEALPGKFASLFDLVFSENHLSFKCFRRSALASIIAAWAVTVLVYGINPASLGDGWVQAQRDPILNPTLVNIGMLGVLAVFVNIIPDYLSLLQTRVMLRWITHRGRLLTVLLADAVLTGAIFVGFICFGVFLLMCVVMWLDTAGSKELIFTSEFWELFRGMMVDALRGMLFQDIPRQGTAANSLGVLFLTTYFTSIWLWIYILVALLSRVLLRLNHGVGLFLRVTDVQGQPIRALGFVAVLLVSMLFLLGLPFIWFE